MLKAKLVVVGGDAKSTEVKLKLPTVIGRGKEAGLTVPHALVSRRHTELFERDGRLFVRDLGSLNGTFIDNVKIEDAQVLEPNQLLTLGNITFRAVYTIDTRQQSPKRSPQSSPSTATVSDPETVTFEELKTTEETRPSPPSRARVDTQPSNSPAAKKPSKAARKKSANAPSNAAASASVGQSIQSSNDATPPSKSQAVPTSSAQAPKPDSDHSPAPSESGSISGLVAFDETVPVESFDSSLKSVAPPAADRKPQVDSPEAAIREGSKANPSEEGSSLNVLKLDEAPDSQESIDLESDIFSIESDQALPPQVSPSALEELPGAEKPMSFVSSLDLGEDVARPASDIGSIKIDLGEQDSSDDDVDPDKLDSFLKKLPQ